MSFDRISIIGRVADGAELLDGQTVKTKVLRDELQAQFPESKIICVDTYHYSRHIFLTLSKTIWAVAASHHVFVLLSRNGRRFLFPVITGVNRIFKRNLYHDVVGGALPGEARKSPALAKQLKKFVVNWVELEDMAKELRSIGVSNVEVLPNFKRLNVMEYSDVPKKSEDPFVFSMFSRIIKEKGIGQAIAAVKEVNAKLNASKVVLRIYGAVGREYEEEFMSLLKDSSDCVRYMGCVPYTESVAALSDSFMLLFPSTYYGEGLPGTIIDAFSAGVPVIATDWHFNEQLVHDQLTGYVYSSREPEKLAERIMYAINHADEVYAMSVNCLEEAKKYTPDVCMKQILSKMREME